MAVSGSPEPDEDATEELNTPGRRGGPPWPPFVPSNEDETTLLACATTGDSSDWPGLRPLLSARMTQVPRPRPQSHPPPNAHTL